MELGFTEPGSLKHLLVLPKGVGVAGGGGDQHGQRKRRGVGRRDPIFVGDEFQRHGPAAATQTVVDFVHQFDTGILPEVMEKVGDQDQIIFTAEGDLKSTAWEELVAFTEARLSGILLSHGKDFWPIEGHHLGVGILLGQGNPKQPMPGSNVQDLPGSAFRGFQQVGNKSGGRHHDRSHPSGKINPHRVFRTHRSVNAFQRAARSHYFSHI